MMSSTTMVIANNVNGSETAQFAASSPSSTFSMQLSQDSSSTLPATDPILSVAPIIKATEAFSKTIALNNAGARYLERGDYDASIKALTASFMTFKKTYTQEKPLLVSLRASIRESERIHSLHQSLPPQQQQQLQQSLPPPPSTFEAMIFDVDELFTWRARSASSYSSSSKRKCSLNNNRSTDIDDHLLCHSYRSTEGGSHDEHEHDSVVRSAAQSTLWVEDDDSEDEGEEHKVDTVYENAIHLPPDFPITQESCGFLSTTITLNLALANHLHGLELQEHSNASISTIHQHLTSAGRYYEYTIRLERARQQEEQRRMTQASDVTTMSPPLFISPFALLVILNNLGQLHLALSNKERSQKCYRQLQSTLMFLLLHTTKRSSGLSTTDNSKDYAVFMENATLGLQSMSSRTMAAAA